MFDVWVSRSFGYWNHDHVLIQEVLGVFDLWKYAGTLLASTVVLPSQSEEINANKQLWLGDEAISKLDIFTLKVQVWMSLERRSELSSFWVYHHDNGMVFHLVFSSIYKSL